jgi:LAO/AO transport system kinase
VDVATAADTTLVVVQPGWGDAVQAAKAGILEIADVFVVNKADREGTGDVVRDLRAMLRMGPKLSWEPPIVKTSTVSGEGVDELWKAVAEHRAHGESSGELEAKRRRRVLNEVEDMVALRLRARTAGLLDQADGAEVAAGLLARRLDPYAAVERLLDRLTG